MERWDPEPLCYCSKCVVEWRLYLLQRATITSWKFWSSLAWISGDEIPCTTFWLIFICNITPNEDPMPFSDDRCAINWIPLILSIPNSGNLHDLWTRIVVPLQKLQTLGWMDDYFSLVLAFQDPIKDIPAWFKTLLQPFSRYQILSILPNNQLHCFRILRFTSAHFSI